MSALTPNQYVDLAGLTVYDEEIKDSIEKQIPDLSELDDVQISSPTSKQVIGYNASDKKWENQSVLTEVTVVNETLVLT